MAPHRHEYCDDHVPLAFAPSIDQFKASIDDIDTGVTNSSVNFSKKKMTAVLDESCELKGILRRPDSLTEYSSSAGSIISFPSHWPHTSAKVHFPPASKIVTATHIRPRTHILDIPGLYYSPQDIRRFKREYKQLARMRNTTREKMEQIDIQLYSTNSNNSVSGVHQQHHDNSFWRSKVGRRWRGSSSGAANCDNSSGDKEGATESADRNDSWDPLKDNRNSVSSLSPYSNYDPDDSDDDEITEDSTRASSSSPNNFPTSIFSSVFDVAREAVSILNGPSSRYYYQNDQRPTNTTSSSSCGTPESTLQAHRHCSTSVHLVDTLYLF